MAGLLNPDDPDDDRLEAGGGGGDDGGGGGMDRSDDPLIAEPGRA